jgi:uncharacterized protein YsxB (DUF464 family)
VVTIRVRKDSRRRLSSFLATGHAGWAQSGSDVVCAAVSTILQTAWLGLAEVAQVPIEGSRRKSRLELRWPEAARSRPGVRAIVETAAHALEALEVQYPGVIRVVPEAEPPSK